MKTRNILGALLALFLLLVLPACQGPDPIRLRSERANLAFARRCAEGWFTALPWTEHDKVLVLRALDDWDRALVADEALLGWPTAAPSGGAK